MRECIIGIMATGFAVAGLFFLRFWRDTRDRLFGIFAVAFFLMAINRLGFAFSSDQYVRGDYLYWIRLLAFVIILLAIADKNTARPSKNEP